MTIKQNLLNSKLPNATTAHMVESFNSCIGNKQKPYASTITFDYIVVEYTYVLWDANNNFNNDTKGNICFNQCVHNANVHIIISLKICS